MQKLTLLEKSVLRKMNMSFAIICNTEYSVKSIGSIESLHCNYVDAEHQIDKLKTLYKREDEPFLLKRIADL